MISQENKSIKGNLENSASGLNEEIFMGKHYDGLMPVPMGMEELP